MDIKTSRSEEVDVPVTPVAAEIGFLRSYSRFLLVMIALPVLVVIYVVVRQSGIANFLLTLAWLTLYAITVTAAAYMIRVFCTIAEDIRAIRQKIEK